MTEDEKRASGGLFFPGDPELTAIKRRAHKLNQDFNRAALLGENRVVDEDKL